MNDLPLISICCLVYNHERYLRDCLDGFFMQTIDFPIEVIIHDDASTDKSVEIIKEYMVKYPNIIRPIFQTENQYSKGKKIIANILFPQARGKYIAYCEGDDFWIDPEKLRKQVVYMEDNPACSMCCHSSIELTNSGKKHRTCYIKETCDLSFDVVFKHWGYIPSASILFRRSSYSRQEHLKIAELCPVGDGPLQIYLATKGTIHFLNDAMCVYRVNSIGSWSEKNRGDNKLLKEHLKKIANWAEHLYGVLPSQYNYLIDDLLVHLKFTSLFIDNQLVPIMREPEYRKKFHGLRLKSKVGLLCRWIKSYMS